MIAFVNAKINIGLQVVNRREDGYHDLQSVFYPVGLHAGTPRNPESFCDILEIVGANDGHEASEKFIFSQIGREVDCPPEKNLVVRAAKLYLESRPFTDFKVRILLYKHLPEGAGMGGGSADCAFTLRLLRDLESEWQEERGLETLSLPDDDTLCRMAASLGADCPFFIHNRPAFVTGIGDRIEPLSVDLSGYWLVVAKPVVSISTKEAFAGITPRPSDFDLRLLPELPIDEWRRFITNDFEKPFFALHPEARDIKTTLYDRGALYASLTGSGSCIYGIFDDLACARNAHNILLSKPTITSSYLLLM